jgi:integrase
VAGWSRVKDRLDELSGVEGWRLHDLRRTVATGLQRLGVRLEVTETVLGHTSGSRAGIVGIYQRHRYEDEAREALNAWAEELKRVVGAANL